MMGLMVLGALAVYLIISIWVTKKAASWAKANNKKPWLWGGAGSDTLIGGDGDDFLKGYENTYFLDTTEGFGFNPTPPSASSVVMGPGFGWQFSYQTPQNGIPVNLIQYELVNARVPDPSGQQDYLLQPIFYVDVNAESYEDGENLIDGGAGDDYVVGGNNNDTLLGGDDNDQLFGREKDDIILGGSGNDVIYGDGRWIKVANDATYNNMNERKAA